MDAILVASIASMAVAVLASSTGSVAPAEPAALVAPGASVVPFMSEASVRAQCQPGSCFVRSAASVASRRLARSCVFAGHGWCPRKAGVMGDRTGARARHRARPGARIDNDIHHRRRGLDCESRQRHLRVIGSHVTRVRKGFGRKGLTCSAIGVSVSRRAGVSVSGAESFSLVGQHPGLCRVHDLHRLRRRVFWDRVVSSRRGRGVPGASSPRAVTQSVVQVARESGVVGPSSCPLESRLLARGRRRFPRRAPNLRVRQSS